MYKLKHLLGEHMASRSGCAFGREQFLALVEDLYRRYASLEAGSSVLLHHSDSIEFAARLLALAQLPVDIVLPPNGQPQTLFDLQQITTLYAGELGANCPPGFTLVDRLSPKTSSASDLHWPSSAQGAGRLVFFTSGSSGPAKAIYKRWDAINCELETLEQTFNGTEQQSLSFIAMVSHQHIYGLLFKLLWPLRYGHFFEASSYQYPEHLVKRLGAHQRWLVVASPAQLSRLVDDNVLVAKRTQIERIFSSGGPLADSDAITLAEQLHQGIVQVYGSTETGGIGYRSVLSTAATPWQPFTGVSLSEELGRLVLQSPLIDEATRLLDDKGQVLSDGQFLLLGRADRTVKVAEKRVDLVGMEARLRQHPMVRACALLQLPSGRLGALVALSKASELQTPSREVTVQLKAWLGQEFEAVCVPRKWRYFEQLPYNSQGKLIYSQLEQYFV
ncbi:AMP-binding protein [Pseudoalteromonas sp. BDTF-M6]|uniref:AMP-binding protein n=1 Tax=Pseudoalteromonas sp. BDTF-M6 TaxID=2796132 RepID=UPI001BAECB75|nr:AMP-binding protein [Pseudoalteromonas sp. BDTF-M6]MBS3797721.1 AMP-binding protein [Pseudoalteromonas sp. BDTF-M6]